MLGLTSSKQFEIVNKLYLESMANCMAKDKEITDLKARVIALEDAHEKQTGIRVRVDNTVTVAKFTKVEMCVMQGAVYSYARSAANLEDTKFAMALYEKIQRFVEGMKE